MADEGADGKAKKARIDLKSRLSSVKGAASMPAAGRGTEPSSRDPLSFPPPASVPPPAISPAGVAPLMPSPFAPPPQPEAPKPTAIQQTIKVEVGEEVEAERKALKRRATLFAGIGLVAGAALGFLIGGVREKGLQGKKAIAGANALAGDVETANKAMLDLSDSLRAGAEALAADKYPEELVGKLKGIHVPFSAGNFVGKGVGGLPAEALGTLLRYTSGVDDLNEKKDKLRNLLERQKADIEKYYEQKKSPTLGFSVVFSRAGDNLVAELVPNKEPLPEKGKWPDRYKVVRRAGNEQKDVEAERYIKGDKLVDFQTPIAVPVEPRSVAAFTAERFIAELQRAFFDMRELIDGKAGPVPGQETEGLIKQGERLIQSLKKIATAA
jgi:hypothetical protein